MTRFFCAVALAVAFCAHASATVKISVQGRPVVFTQEQIENLRYVWDTAKQYASSNGETWHYTATTIALRESSAGMALVGDVGRNANMKNASYGMFQMQIATVRHMSRYYDWGSVKEMSDARIANLLVKSRKFSTFLALAFIDYLHHHTRSYFQQISRYNGGNVNRKYYKDIQQDMRVIVELERLGYIGNADILLDEPSKKIFAEK